MLYSGMAQSAVRLTTGQTSWIRGVDSNVPSTIAGPENPDGLKPNMLAWGNNITVRGGGISPRRGWKRLAAFELGLGLFQEARLYDDSALGGFPYIVAQIAGRTFRCNVGTDNAISEITIPGDPNPADLPQAWMTQGEQFLVIQDGQSLPLFWDGSTMRRSIGINPLPYGVIAVAAVAPAAGNSVVVTLTAPFTGADGTIVLINGKRYQAFHSSVEFITIRNASSPGTVGTVVSAGSSIYTDAPRTTESTIYITLSDFTIPAVGGSVNVNLIRQYTGPVPNLQVGITNNFPAFTITAAGSTPLPPNDILLVNIDDTAGTPLPVNALLAASPELPTAEAMAYYMGRIWLGLGREYIAGDIVGGPSGTSLYNLTDSILRMTENTYLSLGGSFKVPTNAGNIRALSFPANLNTNLGEGQLLVFTREQIYSVNVVPKRADWATLTEPIQRVAQINFGTTSDRSVVQVNGDLFCQSMDGIRSITQALRYFDQWGNVAISSEESRAVDLNDRALLRYGSGIYFDNRLLQTCLPYQTDVGVAHQALLSLDFDLISTLSEKIPPAWEGVNEGLAILRVLQGDFGGRQRAFALVRGSSGAIEVWELTSTDLFDTNASGEARITYQFETPSFTWGKPFMLKELDTVELWIDQLRGTVDFTVEFRPDQHPCWQYWHKWQECAPRNNCEDPGVLLPCDYPTQTYRQQYRSLMVLPKPPIAPCQDYIPRPMNIGFGFQLRITVHGYCRIRGLLVHAFERERHPYDGIRC